VPKSLLEIVTDIITAQASHNVMTSEEIASGIKEIYRLLQHLQAEDISETPRNAIDALQRLQAIREVDMPHNDVEDHTETSMQGSQQRTLVLIRSHHEQ
jgi:hypothetical protein